ncbi:MAG TPA: aminopeptidase [Solirubrobacteraceae bacterium]
MAAPVSPEASATREREALLRAYAQLVVRTGVNLGSGQELLVEAQLDHAPLVRAITEEAYAAGARFVDVSYADPYVRRARAAMSPDDVLGWTPPWMLQRLERAADIGAAVIGISDSSYADVFAGVEGGRLAATRFRDLDRIWLEAVTAGNMAWSLIAYPTERWAAEALGEPDLDRLWDAVAHALYLREPDPAGAWKARLDELAARADALTERGFQAVRYRGPGTELEVGLIEGARWIAGRDRTKAGRDYVANLPTEEVFTTPHRLRADGTIRGSTPLALRGQVIEGIELRLAGGEIVEARATRGEDVLQAEIATDDGGRRLGEIALVDESSRVGEAGIVFNNTLFDENAAAHMAFGAGFAWAVEELDGEPEALGVNDSATHVDFMVGSPELEIDGLEPGGATVALLREGRWQLPG